MAQSAFDTTHCDDLPIGNNDRFDVPFVWWEWAVIFVEAGVLAAMIYRGRHNLCYSGWHARS